MKTILATIGLFLFLATSGLAQEEKVEERIRNGEKYEANKAMVTDGNYLFVADRLVPVTGGSRSIVTNPNQIAISEGNASIHLPYFGEVRAGGGYSMDAGLVYDGPLEKYELEHKDGKERVIVRFRYSDKGETFNYIMSIHKNRNTNVIVNSSSRTSISFYGLTQPLEDEAAR